MYIQIGNDDNDVEFVWKERKNRANQRQHGIGFETAVLVFDDPNHVSVRS